MLHFRRRSMASSSAPPVLPFDTSSRFFAWVHEHSASPLCVDPACTYYNGSRAVDVMGQRRHDKGVMTYDVSTDSTRWEYPAPYYAIGPVNFTTSSGKAASFQMFMIDTVVWSGNSDDLPSGRAS